MEREAFYEQFLPAMFRSNFHIDPEHFAKHHVDEDEEVLAARIRSGIKGLKVVAEIAGVLFDVDIPTSVMELNPVFQQESFRTDIAQFYPLTTTIFYKFVLAQPVILAVFEADSYESSDFKARYERYEEILLTFTKHTGGLGKGFMKTKLSVTGIMMFVFFDSRKAKEFVLQQKNYKKFHMIRKTWVLPWVIDASARKVISHPGLPWLPAVLDREQLEKEIFGAISVA